MHTSLEKEILEWWQDRGEEGETVQNESKHFRALLFGKQKHPVDKDLWIPGAAQPGEQQHVEAVVSEVFVLQQIKKGIELRETWLRQNNLPMNCQMRDDIERPQFLQWAKAQYYAEEYQQTRQREDSLAGGKKKLHKGKKARWDRSSSADSALLNSGT